MVGTSTLVIIEVFYTYVGGIVGITSTAKWMRKSSKKLVGLLLKCNILFQTLTKFYIFFKIKKKKKNYPYVCVYIYIYIYKSAVRVHIEKW